jgi:hypothetical protein
MTKLENGETILVMTRQKNELTWDCTLTIIKPLLTEKTKNVKPKTRKELSEIKEKGIPAEDFLVFLYPFKKRNLVKEVYLN